jgi:hypothetical protein
MAKNIVLVHAGDGELGPRELAHDSSVFLGVGCSHLRVACVLSD